MLSALSNKENFRCSIHQLHRGEKNNSEHCNGGKNGGICPQGRPRRRWINAIRECTGLSRGA